MNINVSLPQTDLIPHYEKALDNLLRISKAQGALEALLEYQRIAIDFANVNRQATDDENFYALSNMIISMQKRLREYGVI